KVEGAVFVVDRAVIEAGRLDDPRDSARGEFLEAGAERRPPCVHGPADTVFFHRSIQVCAERSSISASIWARDWTQSLADFADPTIGTRAAQLVVRFHYLSFSTSLPRKCRPSLMRSASAASRKGKTRVCGTRTAPLVNRWTMRSR